MILGTAMLVIGIAGGSGSGKTTVARKIIHGLPDCSVTIISQDSYYKDTAHLSEEERDKINFDHPDSIEFSLLNKHIEELQKGNSIEKPIYDYITSERLSKTVRIHPVKVVIIEGILVLADADLRQRMDIKVFVDACADDRLIRIMQRDSVERGRDYEQVITHYQKFVKPMHLQFIEPSKRYADIIVPMGGNNHIAVDILKARVASQL